MSTTIDSLPVTIDSTVKSLQALSIRLRHERFTVLTEIASSLAMTVLPVSEHSDLVQRASQNKEARELEVTTEVGRQVETLNLELKHRIEMETLKNTAEIQILKAKITLLETKPCAPVITASTTE